jgi:hypothetical protein
LNKQLKALDFTKEDAQVKKAAEAIREARNRLPRQNENQ